MLIINTIKSGKKSAIALKKDLRANQCTMKIVQNLKQSQMKVKRIKTCYDNGTPREASLCIFLSVILINFVFKMDKECKYKKTTDVSMMQWTFLLIILSKGPLVKRLLMKR